MNQQCGRVRARRILRRAVALPALALVVVAALAVPSWAGKPPPDTVIDSQPAALTNSTTASFTFHSTGQSATYVCRLDGGTSSACTSPKGYSGLAAGAHTFSVVSTAGGLVDPSPATASWTIDVTPPSSPTNLAATTPSPTSVVLTWTAGTDNTGVTGNQIVRDGSLLATVGTVTTYTDSTVLGGSTHTYAVRALDGAGNVSPSSTSVQATTPLPPPAPDTLIDSGPASPTKSTTASFAFHSPAAGATFTCKLDTAKAGACTSPKSYTGLTDGAHTFSVFATVNGVSDPTPATATWTVDTTAPSIPANLSATTSATSAVLNWTASTDTVGVTGYDLFRSGTLFASLGAVTTYTDSTIRVGTIYSYAVRAHDAAGNLSALSNTVAAAPSADYNSRLTRAPYLTDLVGLHVAINFATDQSDTTASVQYGTVGTGGSCSPTTVLAATKKTINVNNVFEYQWLGDLTLPATGTYCYRVYLGGADLLGANASPTFTTQVPFGSTESFSFDVFGDWGSLNGTGQNADQANLMAQIAASGARFALTVGDNGYPNGSQLNYGDLQQTGVDTSAIFGPKQWTVPGSSIPLFTAVGNHGVSGTQHTDITTWTQGTAVSTSNGRYQNDVYCCVNGSNQSNYGSEWYAFSAGNVRFYVLDSAWGDLNPGTKTPYDNDAAAHFAPGTPEYNWLLNDLTTHPTQLKFAFSHFPFYADNPDDGTDAALDGATNLEGLLGQHGVQIAFQGHAHMYERNKASAAGMPITYITGGGGAALQPIGPCTSNDLYGIGWSWSHSTGSACGSAVPPTTKAAVFHFLKVTVSGTTVTVAPTDSTGQTFDVQTYTFKVPTDTYIDSAPPAGTTSSSATFTFHASGPNATFLCRLDNGTAAACTSPKTYTGLAQAAHTFSVAATVNKSADPTPALATWTVDSTPPAAPTGLTASASSPFGVDLAWTAATDNTGVTGYDIYRDGSAYQSIGPVTSYSDAALGGSTHQYAIRARDVAGNVSPLSATASATTPPPPAPVFADGFESGDLSAWNYHSGLVVEGSNVNSGVEAVEGNTTNGATYAKKTLPATYSDAYARVWFNVVAQPSQVNLLRLRDASGGSLGYVYIETTGQLGYHNDALATPNKLSDLAPSPGWHALELHLKTDAAAGVVEIWLDNSLVADLSSSSLNTGTAPVAAMQIGEVQSGLTYDVAFDDVAFGTSRLGPATDSSAPTVPAGVTATATSPFTADVSWSASTDNLGVAGYDVFRDGTLVASVDNVLTWTDIGTLPGTTHGYAVRARDASGNVSALSAEASVTQPTAATPLFSDGFETGDLSGWTTPAGLTVQSANVHSGAFGAAGITTASAAYAKRTLPTTYADAYARVAFMVNSQASQVTLLRLRDTPTGNGGYLYLTSAGKLGFRSDALSAGTTSSVSPGPGWHALELHLNISNGAADVWLDGAAVPDLTFPSINLGTAPIGVMQIGDTAAGTWDILFDDAAFGTSRVGPSGDTAPPSAPANLAGSASSPFSVALSWDASTDDVGVTGYDVFRDGTLLEQVGAVTTYADSTVLASSMHQYAVRSRDAAGNVSALSQAVSVTTPAAAAPVFSDGFETGDTSAWTTASALTVQQANAHSGNFAAEGSTTTGATFAKKTLLSTYNDAYARVAFLVSSQASQVTLLRLRDTPMGNGGYVYLTSAGKLGFRSDALAAGTTSNVSPGAGWHALELHLHIATGTVEVWLDGALVPDLSLSGINLGTASMGAMQIGDTATTGTWDIVFDDAAFSTSRLGPSGDTAPPSTPANLAGAASSPFSVDLTWDASTDDVGVTGYDVFRDGALLAGIGDVLTFTDGAVLAGSSHSYAVRARDGAGNVSGWTALVVVSTPAAVAPLFSDGFETGDLSGWTSPSGLTVQTGNVHSGHFAAEGNTTASAAYAKKTLLSTYSDAYARVAFSVNSQTSQVTLLRLRDTPAGNGGYLYLTAGGSLAFRSDALTAGTVSNVSPGAGWHALELHLNIPSGLVEVWLDGAAVPDLTFPSIDLGTAPIGVLQIGDTASGTWDIAFDDAAFGTSRLGPAGDTTAPSAPANLVGTASSPFSADLSWSASTDDVGVTGYDVFRDGTLLKQLGAVTTYTDSTVLASSAYLYTVWARDAAGNVSPLSAGASVLTPAAATPVFSDGFETGNVSGWSTGATVTVQSATVHSGGFAAESNGTGFAKKTLPSTYSDAYARVAFNVITPGSQVTLLRLRDTPTGNGGYLYLTSAGKLAFRNDALGASTLSSVSPGAGWHALELHLNITTGAVEVWLDGAAVPDLTLTGTDLGAAQIGVMQIGDTASGTWDIALDDAAFGTSRLGPSGDVTPPSTPANVAGAASSAFSVDLSWDASTDNVGVTGYDVFRDGTLLKQLGAVTTYTDSTVLASSMHQYTVRARDAAGNVSPVSAAVPVTTPAAATPLFSDAFETGDLSAWTSPSGLTVQATIVRSGSFAAEGVAGGPAYAKKTVASTSDAYARVAFSVINAGSHPSLALPARGTFSYPWFPEGWNRNGFSPATQYVPTLGYYNSVDVMAQHVQAMLYGGFQFDVSSWWGQGSTEDVRLPALLSAARGTSLKIAPYYEGEGNATAGVTGSPNPSSAQITSDLNYLAAHYIADPNYLWIAGKPALFVYGDATDNCSTVDRWAAANAAASTHFYLVLKVFPGYPTCANHPDNWHQYGGAAAEDSQGTHAFAISPGFYKYSEASPRLTRDPARWATNVHDLNCASADFKLVTTFNEWGEGTSVESATQWETASGEGSYLDELHNDTTCNGTNPAGTPTTSQVTLLRLRDTPTGAGGYLYLTSDGKLAFRSDALTVATISSVSPGPGWHALELHLNITSGAVEVWLDGAAVPDLTFSSINLGNAPIGVMQIGDTATGPWDIAFDDAAFGTSRLGPSGETTPPSTPANLVGTATSAFSVDLSWDASTDNVGVTGYDLFRDGTLLKQLGAVTTYTDSTVLANSTHQYAVRARDASGNLSPLSAAVPVTTPAANTPVFSDGFESGNLNAWTPKGGLQAVSGDAASGSWAVEGNTTVGATYAKKAFSPATYNDAYARTAFKVKAQTDLIGLLRVRDAGGTSLGFLYLNATGRLGFHADVPNTDVTSAVVPAAGVWHAVELHVNVTSATVEVWLDGVSVAALSLSGVNLGSNPVGAFQIGEAQAGRTYDILFDDAAFSASRLGI